MENKPAIINGGVHKDQKGTLRFFNDFNMEPIKRFYIIEHSETETIRGWRAHRIEQRWFQVTEGAFKIQLVRIDNWETPSKNLPIEEFIISASDNQVLHVPVGFATSIQALENNSKVILFADYGIENAKLDDYLYPVDYFIK
ncbi:WxcM-like domain-containing protein [Albibacterium bauzanense]|uniref:dTDP-4-dehydrorhamnose 3,5-epimerase n=1 Tax=Albibacterium bauzanense TaxID=653929 RepID=A0A4V2PY72_9SPHI|nr:WxcM-like domain-containing protein [Albibacterium bauzanense]TCK84881.1 dTDP-4-dehydrorhamnose 3,5-epimerase [Albibacterium bauzanense]